MYHASHLRQRYYSISNAILKSTFKTGHSPEHACNLSYSGGRDQEDPSSKSAQVNSSRDPIWKIPNTKMG
jgi:hypothetical protein